MMSMQWYRKNRKLVFYILCAVFTVTAIISVVRIIQDIAATVHTRNVNARVQEYMASVETGNSAGSDSNTETGASGEAAFAAETGASAELNSASEAGASVKAASAAVNEIVYDSPRVITLTTPIPTLSSSDNTALAESESARENTQNSAAERIGEDTPDSSAETVPSPEQRTYQYIGDTLRSDIAALQELNPECVGWLRITDVVNLPVMYSPDGNYYETHDFYLNESAGGTLFLDTMHPFRAETQHLVIHGHNMKDGTMFGHLIHYQQLDYCAKHPTMVFFTPYRAEYYTIFSVAVVSTDPASEQYLNYLSPTRFSDEDELQNWLTRLRRRSVQWKNIPVTMEDALLTLSTCIGEDRLLIVGKRNNY